MGDAGFFRGTSSEQDGRFSDKEKKLMKQLRFEENLGNKINISKINLDVIKPWITLRLNEMLGMEDDVVVEYVLSQLEDKNLNPKVMQINITGFLNARGARIFMGELWTLLCEANESEDGIPKSLIEKKMEEMKAESATNGGSGFTNAPSHKENDWTNRYNSLSCGRYSGPTKEKEVSDDRIPLPGARSPPRRRRVSGSPPRRDEDREKKRMERRDEEKKRDEEESKRREEARMRRRAEEKLMERKREERKEREEREKERDRERRRRTDERRRKSKSRSRSPARRRFTEGGSAEKHKKKVSSGSDSESEDDHRRKKKKKHAKHSSDEDSDRKERKEKKSKKHKKEKKRKERKRSPTPKSSSSASDTE